MNKFINGVQRGVLLLFMMYILCSTRDNSAAETDKSITLYEFEDIAEYCNDNGNGRLYWIAFNGKISDIDFDSDEIFIITLIN